MEHVTTNVVENETVLASIWTDCCRSPWVVEAEEGSAHGSAAVVVSDPGEAKLQAWVGFG